MIEKIEIYIKQLDTAITNLVMAIDNMPAEMQHETRQIIKKLTTEKEKVDTFYKQGRKLI